MVQSDYAVAIKKPLSVFVHCLIITFKMIEQVRSANMPHISLET